MMYVWTNRIYIPTQSKFNAMQTSSDASNLSNKKNVMSTSTLESKLVFKYISYAVLVNQSPFLKALPLYAVW